MKLFKAFGFTKSTTFASAPKPKINTIIVDDTNVSTMEMVKPTKEYPIEVQQIHHEFHSAADNLLLEAKSIIEEARTKNVTKVNRLELLGFKQASQVTELKPLQQKAELSKEQLESLAYYQRKYPFNKFITEEQVKTICHKYNLVCGKVDRFKGFVPEKNLKDIEKFSLKKEDYYDDKSISTYGSNIGRIENDNGASAKRYANIYDLIEGNINNLKICAPIKDMDLQGLRITEGYKLEAIPIPDPVVLQPVKNGYLIITAWGDEASDELVINQKFN